MIPFKVRIKSFLGMFALTPFEEHLINRLREAIGSKRQGILDFQLSQFNKVARVIDWDGDPNAYGYTEFHRVRFGKPVLEFEKKLTPDNKQQKLATATVSFDGGIINVEFWVVYGRLSSMKYRSPQMVFYPPADYVIETLEVLA